jgi:hypothetical protein
VDESGSLYVIVTVVPAVFVAVDTKVGAVESAATTVPLKS